MMQAEHPPTASRKQMRSASADPLLRRHKSIDVFDCHADSPATICLGIRKGDSYEYKDTLIKANKLINGYPYYCSDSMHLWMVEYTDPKALKVAREFQPAKCTTISLPRPGQVVEIDAGIPSETIHALAIATNVYVSAEAKRSRVKREWVMRKGRGPDCTDGHCGVLRPFPVFASRHFVKFNSQGVPLHGWILEGWNAGKDKIVELKLTWDELKAPSEALMSLHNAPGNSGRAPEEEEQWKARDSIKKLLLGLSKLPSGGTLTVRDLLQNVNIVQEHLPQLIDVFPKVDQNGDGNISADDLLAYFAPKLQSYKSQSELDLLWAGLTKDLSSSISIALSDLAKPDVFAWANDKIPELIDDFSKIDTDRDCVINRQDFDAFFGNVDVWLEKKLSHIIGMEQLKGQIMNFFWSVKLDQERRRAGLYVNQDEAVVIMFKGGPGTGKTTFGRLIADLLFKIGIVPKRTFVEVQRENLVGAHIGETEKKTQAVIDSSHGGVLFVDEAYRLHVKGSDRDFGAQAITTLMKAMTVKGKVIILAGYPQEMEEFTSANEGIKRRITYEFFFEDYSPSDLAQILRLQVAKRGFTLVAEVADGEIADLVEQCTTESQRRKYNGGLCEHIARNAIATLNTQVVCEARACTARREPVPAPTVTLELQHLKDGCDSVPRSDAVVPVPVLHDGPTTATATTTGRALVRSFEAGVVTTMVVVATGLLLRSLATRLRRS